MKSAAALEMLPESVKKVVV